MREKGKGKRKYAPNKMKEEIVKSILESIEVGMSITDACELEIGRASCRERVYPEV
jgi:hypothetical protein